MGGSCQRLSTASARHGKALHTTHHLTASVNVRYPSGTGKTGAKRAGSHPSRESLRVLGIAGVNRHGPTSSYPGCVVEPWALGCHHISRELWEGCELWAHQSLQERCTGPGPDSNIRQTFKEHLNSFTHSFHTRSLGTRSGPTHRAFPGWDEVRDTHWANDPPN